MGSFDVVVLGFKLNGPERPARVLEDVLGLPEAEAKALSRSFPIVVRPAVCAEEGDAWAMRLRERGARVEVRPVHTPQQPSLPERYLLGTLRIMLSRRPPPPVAMETQASVPVPEPVRQPVPEAFGGRMLDDVFEPEVSGLRLSLDHDALDHRSQQVSGGRPAAPNVAPPLVYANLQKRRLPWRTWGVVCLAFAMLLVGSRQLVHGTEGDDAAQATGVSSADDVPLHPLLAIAPAPMEAPLASILRRQIPGVHNVAVEQAGQPLQCMLVAGNAMERGQRMRSLLATGIRVRTSREVDAQLREHAETLRLAEGDASARYDGLCLQRSSAAMEASPDGARGERTDEQFGFTGPGRP